MHPDPDAYAVDWTRRARRDLNGLPFEVAAALWEHATGPIASSPYRCGGRLHGRYEGCLGARRGDYRLIYRVIEDQHTVRIEHVGPRPHVYGGG